MALLHLPLDPRTRIQIYTSYNFTYMFLHIYTRYLALWVYNVTMYLVLSCRTISSMVVLLSGPLVGTPEFYSSVIL